MVRDTDNNVGLLALMIVVVLTASTFGSNSGLVTLAMFVLIAGTVLVWRPGESPVMPLIFALQWLQAAVKVLYTNVRGTELRDVARWDGDIELAVQLSLVALLCLALGMRWGAGRWQSEFGVRARQQAVQHAPIVWMTCYGSAAAVSVVAGAFAYVVPVLSQPLLALSSLKWAFYFMLTFAVFLRRGDGLLFWVIATSIEFMLGIGGYFSDFKTVIFFSAMGIVAAGVRFTLGRAATVFALGLVTLSMGIVWTAVKSDYRAYVSGGEDAQVVVVDFESRIGYLAQLIGEIDKEKFKAASEQFIDRLSYVEFFSAAILYVPTHVDHTNGEIWWDAIIRPFMPRALFPEKSIIDDSERTSAYTGLTVSGSDKGTSISIGYIGESYIDFGSTGMMIPILGFGYLLGLTYRKLAITGPTKGIFGLGLASSALMSFQFLEASITKVFGSFIVTILVIWLFYRIIAPRFFPWLLVSNATSTEIARYSSSQPY